MGFQTQVGVVGGIIMGSRFLSLLMHGIAMESRTLAEYSVSLWLWADFMNFFVLNSG